MALGSKWFHPRGHLSYINSYGGGGGEALKIFFCETRRPRPLTFDIKFYLVDLYQHCSGPQGSLVLHRLKWGKKFKKCSCVKLEGTGL